MNSAFFNVEAPTLCIKTVLLMPCLRSMYHYVEAPTLCIKLVLLIPCLNYDIGSCVFNALCLHCCRQLNYDISVLYCRRPHHTNFYSVHICDIRLLHASCITRLFKLNVGKMTSQCICVTSVLNLLHLCYNFCIKRLFNVCWKDDKSMHLSPRT